MTSAIPAASNGAPPWSPWKKLWFRFGLLYFLLYTHPFPLQYVPNPQVVQDAFGTQARWVESVQPFFEKLGAYSSEARNVEYRLVDQVAERVFGFEQVLDRPMGSGDPTFAYVQLATYLVLAIAAALLWSLVDRRRRAHRVLAPWLHLGLRYSLAFTMLGYGLVKLIPNQFGSPMLGRLVTPYGESSPMNALWTFMASAPAYVVFAGAAEVLAGVLLCFRRTATLGALVAAGVLTNVVAVNYCYDVPVKLYSSHLLVFALLLCLPDARRLVDLFLRNRPARARDLSRPRLPYIGHLVKVIVVGTVVISQVRSNLDRYEQRKAPPALHGIWDVTGFVEEGSEVPPLLTDPFRWRALLVERPTLGWLQAMDGSLRSVGLVHDEEAGTLTLTSRAPWSYRVEGDELVLEGEHSRTFREVPFDFQSPGEPRDPQVRLRLRRAAPGPNDLLGTWTVESNERIGEVWTARRSSPASWTAVTFEEDGVARFELAGGRECVYTYALTPESSQLVFTSSAELTAGTPEPGRLALSGEFRGRAVTVELARRDLDAFLLLRRGYHWINEIPLNRF